MYIDILESCLLVCANLVRLLKSISILRHHACPFTFLKYLIFPDPRSSFHDVEKEVLVP